MVLSHINVGIIADTGSARLTVIQMPVSYRQNQTYLDQRNLF
jgi:hypothetical protein